MATDPGSELVDAIKGTLLQELVLHFCNHALRWPLASPEALQYDGKQVRAPVDKKIAIRIPASLKLAFNERREKAASAQRVVACLKLCGSDIQRNHTTAIIAGPSALHATRADKKRAAHTAVKACPTRGHRQDVYTRE